MRFFRLEGHVSDSKVCAIGTDVGLRQCEPACVAQHSVAGCAGHACLSGDDARQMVHLLPLSASLQWAEVVSCSDASESGCCATWSTWPREDVCRGFGDVSLRLTLESRRASRRRGDYGRSWVRSRRWWLPLDWRYLVPVHCSSRVV